VHTRLSKGPCQRAQPPVIICWGDRFELMSLLIEGRVGRRPRSRWHTRWHLPLDTAACAFLCLARVV
jgi:hypothetical protein